MQSLQPIGIGIGLIIAIFLVGSISGGHLNPAVSITSLFNNVLSMNETVIYITAQVLGAILAWWLNKQIKKRI